MITGKVQLLSGFTTKPSQNDYNDYGNGAKFQPKTLIVPTNHQGRGKGTSSLKYASVNGFSPFCHEPLVSKHLVVEDALSDTFSYMTYFI